MKEEQHHDARGQIEEENALQSVPVSMVALVGDEVFEIRRHTPDNDGGHDEARAPERQRSGSMGEGEWHSLNYVGFGSELRLGRGWARAPGLAGAIETVGRVGCGLREIRDFPQRTLGRVWTRKSFMIISMETLESGLRT